jgi:hypothetical protein
MKLVRCKKPENCMVSDDPVITLEDRSIVTGYYHEEGSTWLVSRNSSPGCNSPARPYSHRGESLVDGG